MDFVLTWQPKHMTPVDLLNVESTILTLAKVYGIKRATFDRWNSAGKCAHGIHTSASPLRRTTKSGACITSRL
ncbi:MAG: hypothetical protein ABIZ56_11430, partial [Chthoniobacteraceae bacterium]